MTPHPERVLDRVPRIHANVYLSISSDPELRCTLAFVTSPDSRIPNEIGRECRAVGLPFRSHRLVG